MIGEEYVSVVSESRRKKQAERVAKSLEEEKGELVEWDFKTDRPVNNKLRKVELTVGKLKVVRLLLLQKSKPAFNLYHDSASHLYASSVADKLVLQLHVTPLPLRRATSTTCPRAPGSAETPTASSSRSR